MDRMSALRKIRNIDYTVIFARNMAAMRRFYGEVMQFPVESELGPQWIAYRVGSALLALTERGLMFNDAPTPPGALSLQMAFRVAPKEVDACGQALHSRRAHHATGNGSALGPPHGVLSRPGRQRA
jgi:lactoylglutathione lyase